MKHKMKKVVGVLGLFAVAATMTGCLFVPKSQITGEILGAPFKIKTPQNQNLQGLKILAEKTGTNSAKVSVEIQSLTAVTDPSVVSATAAGQASLLTATAGLVQQSAALVGQAATAYATGGASLVVPKVAPAATVVSTNSP